MTYADLKYHLDKLTPVQLAYKVKWSGEERGGPVEGLAILSEAMCNPSGDGWETMSEVIKCQIEEGESEEEARAFAESEIVAPKGMPVIIVDGGWPDMLSNPSEAICDHARENVFAPCLTCFPVL